MDLVGWDVAKQDHYTEYLSYGQEDKGLIYDHEYDATIPIGGLA
jgi:hypothetical protein